MNVLDHIGDTPLVLWTILALGSGCENNPVANCNGYAIQDEVDALRFRPGTGSWFYFEAMDGGPAISWPESWDSPYILLLCNAEWERSLSRLEQLDYRGSDEVYLSAGSGAGSIELFRGPYACLFSDQGDGCTDEAAVSISVYDIGYDADRVEYTHATYVTCDDSPKSWIAPGADVNAGFDISFDGSFGLLEGDSAECVQHQGGVHLTVEHLDVVMVD